VTRLVAIHQPNFLPWLGWFDKLARADVLVLLDAVQFPRTGSGSWTNRVRMLVGGRPAWVTAPVIRADGGLLPINRMRVDASRPWRKKLLRTVRMSYGRAPCFDEVFPTLSELIELPTARLAELNEAALHSIALRLRLDPAKMVRQSDLSARGSATELLIELTKAVGGTAYLAGGGAGGYQDDAAFEAAGLTLVPQRFEHPRYPQMVEEHVPGLSIVDALMCCGWSGTAAFLGAGS